MSSIEMVPAPCSKLGGLPILVKPGLLWCLPSGDHMAGKSTDCQALTTHQRYPRSISQINIPDQYPRSISQINIPDQYPRSISQINIPMISLQSPTIHFPWSFREPPVTWCSSPPGIFVTALRRGALDLLNGLVAAMKCRPFHFWGSFTSFHF